MRRAERLLRRAAGQQPTGQGDEGDHQHGGDEDARDPVGQPLDGGLLVLGVLDQAHHVGQLGVAPDLRGPDHEATAHRHRAPHHPVAGSHVDRQGLAGHGAAVDGRLPEEHLAVGGHRLPRPHDEPVAHLELGQPGAGARRPSASSTATSLAPTAASDRRASPRPALAEGLEIAAGQEEGGDAGGDVEIDGAPRLVGEHEEPRRGGVGRCPARTWRRATSRWRPRCRARPGCPWWTCGAGRCGRPLGRRARPPR